MKSDPNKIQDFGINLARKNNSRHDGRENWAKRQHGFIY